GAYGIFCVIVFSIRWSSNTSLSVILRDWPSSWIFAMLGAQLLIPLIACSPLAFAQPTGNGYGPPYLIKYPYINDFAIFSSPVLLLIISSKLRHLISSIF
ncbi:hypothetical protein PENTCL1PPCAC_639, partial [Pristionchus entomophagus]